MKKLIMMIELIIIHKILNNLNRRCDYMMMTIKMGREEIFYQLIFN